MLSKQQVMVCCSQMQSKAEDLCGFVAVQDFEALQPNLLARTIETVEGGGLVVLLLSSLTSLSSLYTMMMVCPLSTHGT